MSVLALGLNHATAPLALRERLAVAAEHIAPQVRSLQAHLSEHVSRHHPDARPEAALLSTCNRTELYLAGGPDLAGPALAWLARVADLPEETVAAHSYVYADEAAARHAFRVAAGLDSMVLGEPQILGQVKDAVRRADDAGTLGSTLHQLFQRGFSVAKDVRTQTELGAHSISMAAAAVRLAAQLFEDLGQLNILFVGAGEMIELAATHFAARRPARLVVMNRTQARATALAERFGGASLPLSQLAERLPEFDAVVSCTASAEVLIHRDAVEAALRKRKHRPLFMVDLAVPRDIAPEVAQLRDVYLYTVDDLSGLVQVAGEKRQAAVRHAEAIVENGVQGFAHWQAQRHSVPLLQALQQQMEAWREEVKGRARRQLARGESPEAVLDGVAHQLGQKMLHGVFAALQQAEGTERQELEALVARLLLRP